MAERLANLQSTIRNAHCWAGMSNLRAEGSGFIIMNRVT